jgi:hypothetical protein
MLVREDHKMTKKLLLTTDERQTITSGLNSVLDMTARAMTAQKISREQMLIIDNALAIVRYTLEIET